MEAEVELNKLNLKKQKLEDGSILSKEKSNMNSISGITIKIRNQIQQWGSGIKQGLGHILKYAGALLSLRGIYSILSSSAKSWLSSQNTQAKQLSANIEYMKYAMGSVFAPVIEYVTSLIYNLMKAMQSLVYTFSGVNIFAKATASSMKSASGSAKQTSKSLSSVHSEINNVSDNKNSNTSGTPNIDLSEVDKTPNKIIDVIKNGNWNEIGTIIGEKLNNALAKTPWDKIQSTAKNIASGIAQTLNGFIGTTDWNQVGNTFAQGLNSVIYFAYNFINTFDWKQFGQSIVDGIDGFLNNFDWQACGKTIGDFTKGLLDVIVVFIEQYDFQKFPNKIAECLSNVDWTEIAKRVFELIGAAMVKVSIIGAVINAAEVILNICNLAVGYFQGKIEECGGNVILGILKGIGDAVIGIGQWIYDNVFKPFIDGFKNAFGIHSPSTVMEEQGHFIVEGLKNGLTGIWEKVAGVFEGFGENVKTKFNEIKGNISDTWENVKSKTREKWENIKGNVTETWENIKGKAKDKFDNIKSKISESWNKIKEDKKLSSMSDTIKNTFSGLGSSASVWGKDLVSNMATGIKNNIHKVTTAVSSVASKIKSFLHFTEPDEGPLSNFHTYMPDMIDLMVSGIKSNTNKIKNEMENLAGTMSYTINTEAVTGIPSTSPTIKPINIQSNNMMDTFGDVLSSYGGNNGQPVHITIQYLGKEIFNDTIDYINSKTRRTGKNTIVTVGD